MLKRNHCSKSLRTLQGLKGHIRIKHSIADIEPVQNTNKKYPENNDTETYPFGTTMQYDSEQYEFANLCVMCGFVNSLQEYHPKKQKLLKLMAYHDPQFLVALRNKQRLNTKQDYERFGWFFVEAGMAEDIEDFGKKFISLVILYGDMKNR